MKRFMGWFVAVLFALAFLATAMPAAAQDMEQREMIAQLALAEAATDYMREANLAREGGVAVPPGVSLERHPIVKKWPLRLDEEIGLGLRRSTVYESLLVYRWNYEVKRFVVERLSPFSEVLEDGAGTPVYLVDGKYAARIAPMVAPEPCPFPPR